MAQYPGSVASFTTKVDLQDINFAAHINALQGEVVALESVLGTLPQGTADTVRERLTNIESLIQTINNKFSNGLLDTDYIQSEDGTSANLTAQLSDVESRLAAVISGFAGYVTSNNANIQSLADSIVVETNRAEGAETGVQTALTNYMASRERMAIEVSRSVNQGIPNGVWTKVVIDTIDTTYNVYSGAFEANGRFYTIGPVLGTYLFDATVTWDSNAFGIRGIRFVTAGGSVLSINMLDASDTNDVSVFAQFEHLYQAGYYVQCEVFHTATDGSGNPISLNLIGDTPTTPLKLKGSYTPTADS